MGASTTTPEAAVPPADRSARPRGRALAPIDHSNEPHGGGAHSGKDGGLVCGFDIAADGSATAIGHDTLGEPPAAGCWRWVHLDRRAPEAVAWLNEEAGLDDIVVETLLTEDTRPRCTNIDGGTLVILRVINLNPGASPEDMVAIRLWIEKDRIISLRHRRIFAVREIRDDYERGRGPATPGEFVSTLAADIVEVIGSVIREIEDDLDQLEVISTEGTSPTLREQLVEVRRTAIPMRRYLSPQRDAFLQFLTLKAAWMDEDTRTRLHQSGDESVRHVEDLDALRERAGLLHEELSNRQSEQMNRNMYMLSVIAAVFLPLGFVTGLLGVNVGGIPLASDASGFAIITIALLVLVVIELALFRMIRWI